MKNLTPEILKKYLYDSIDSLSNDKARFFNNPDKAFSRTQKLSLRETILFPVITGKETTSVEMMDYFSKPDIPPSQAAMSYRRDQIKPAAYEAFLKDFSSKLPREKNQFKLPLIACDGSRINTPYNPKDKESFVDCIEGRKGFNQYHLNTLYDLVNDRFVDAVIQGYSSMNEQAAFCEMVDRYPEKALFITDRGYYAFNVIAHLINKGHFFVCRISSFAAEHIFPMQKEINSLGSYDIEDVIHLSRRRTRQCKQLRNYHYLKKDHTYEFIPMGSDKCDVFSLRLVKFPLSEGSEEYLLTNLPQSEYPTATLKDLYHMRWEIETSYRYLKYAAELIHIHSLKKDFILQEIYAKLICYNFCAAVYKYVNNPVKSTTKHHYVTDKTYLFKACLRFLKGKLKDIQSLVSKKKVPVRTGRTYDRNIRRQHADTLQYR